MDLLPFLWCHRRAVSTSGTLALGSVVLGSPRSQRVGLGLRPGLLLCEATAGDAGFFDLSPDRHGFYGILQIRTCQISVMGISNRPPREQVRVDVKLTSLYDLFSKYQMRHKK